MDVILEEDKCREISFETFIIEQYCRRGSGMKEAPAEMYPAGVLAWRIEDTTRALWAAKFPSAISELSQKAHV